MSDGKKGTPTTLQEAILNALDVGRVESISWNVRNHVRDFLAQRFGVAMLKASAEHEELICDLWTAITGEDCKKLKGKGK